MIRYRIVHHVPGRIRIEVPSMKGLCLKRLEGLTSIPLPSGIEGVRPNPLTGSILITYDPVQINIMTYLKDVAASGALEDCLTEKRSL